MNGFPPEGVYVIISNGAVLVTNQTVEIGTAEGEDVGTESEVGSNEETESVDGSDEGNGSDGDGFGDE